MPGGAPSPACLPQAPAVLHSRGSSGGGVASTQLSNATPDRPSSGSNTMSGDAGPWSQKPASQASTTTKSVAELPPDTFSKPLADDDDDASSVSIPVYTLSKPVLVQGRTAHVAPAGAVGASLSASGLIRTVSGGRTPSGGQAPLARPPSGSSIHARLPADGPSRYVGA